MRINGLIAAAVLLWGLTAAAGVSAGQQNNHPRLPAGEGRDVMIRVCSKCHEPEQAADQQLDGAGWKELVEQMAGMGAIASDEEFEQIVSYLTKAFPPPAK